MILGPWKGPCVNDTAAFNVVRGLMWMILVNEGSLVWM